MAVPLRLLRRALTCGALLLPAALLAQVLPPEIETALTRSRIPADAVTLLVADVDPRQPARLAHRAEVPVNPASVAKLVTTYAGLDLLGPAYSWTTPVYADGVVQEGTLRGNLYLRGQGDPRLVMERLWLLMRRLQGLGIRRIAGDIVLDRSAFELPAQDPAAFDGEPLRPYNAAPDALLLNFRSVVFHFTPASGVATVQMEPPLAGVQWPVQVPLATGPCGDWRAALKADFSDPQRVRFAGGYPVACGSRSWPVAPPDPAGHAARTLAGMWLEMGGRLDGTVREGRVPEALSPLLETSSAPLAEVVRDINKFSNNVMAQQLFLTLSLQRRGTGTWAGSREVLQQWWRERLRSEPPSFGNGSGLSREERISASQIARLLQHAWASPLMPEFVSSLPVSGIDGTARRTGTRSAGQAHLKTGSLRDVTGVAGYVHGADGRRWVVVAIANHPNAGAFRPVIDAVVEWAGTRP
ncbi:D-alanyl-D-alanine carboxypeptidase/D-alanyl-D-alanine-endopeptidase [Ramlibacter sp. AW1]|uniref:D-alanyl-D-alanine carboxypeptidase/D-alanyl-D-alanine-endopeptidase n=1 Tax=Ramlibacter aurantiacus TaxID=2801330 RepID=A0A937D6P5_9BURK|nr:D-alanyl-D-alanine carboxypeptidase/D-alanyl-D-alanine-endopeptidase [Ramlibacter aurantiacus]MBL0421163.1 D-alanyl-D-alanine carboxypeptidase/D-alanyl-D-alanine-endopeptidase [Ramlibacter aurantiacus]